MIKLNSIEFSKKKVISYNRTHQSFRKVFYPKNYDELKNILKFFRKANKKILIKSGECGHGDKTNLETSELVVSLTKINKIKSINKKKLILKAQSGINLYNLFNILKRKNLTLFNIPGGKNVSLGGAIAGNVHGRPQNKKFSVFGDNVISLKVMLESGRIVTLKQNNKLFYKLIGGLSIFGIILEAEIKLIKISEKEILKSRNLVKNKKDFRNISLKNKNFYGYINFFNKKRFEGIFFTFKELKLNNRKKTETEKYYTFQDFLHFFKLISLISFFINNLTLKIFYKLLFLFYKIFPNTSKTKILNYENSIYFINLNKYLPFYFRGGMIEIQFSIQDKKFFYLIEKIKLQFSKYKIYPFFFIIKKLEKSTKNYIFNFPTNNLCVSLGFSKNDYLNKKDFFVLFYNLLFKNNCNLYITKDETFLDNTKNKKIKRKFINETVNASKLISSDFKEKIFS